MNDVTLLLIFLVVDQSGINDDLKAFDLGSKVCKPSLFANNLITSKRFHSICIIL